MAVPALVTLATDPACFGDTYGAASWRPWHAALAVGLSGTLKVPKPAHAMFNIAAGEGMQVSILPRIGGSADLGT